MTQLPHHPPSSPQPPVCAVGRASNLHHGQQQRQRGVSLFVILIMVLLVTLAALWGSRSALFNELIVGNDADYQRAFEAASAMIEDAELDIRGTRPDGTTCEPDASRPAVCREGSTLYFPAENREVGDFLDRLNARPTGCQDGLCRKRTGAQDFWNDPAELARMLPVAARFGQYTGADLRADSRGNANPILLEQASNDMGAWYWIEVLPYTSAAGTSGLLADGGDPRLLELTLRPTVVYRITALAKGRREGTMVVLQQTYARQTTRD